MCSEIEIARLRLAEKKGDSKGFSQERPCAEDESEFFRDGFTGDNFLTSFGIGRLVGCYLSVIIYSNYRVIGLPGACVYPRRFSASWQDTHGYTILVDFLQITTQH